MELTEEELKALSEASGSALECRAAQRAAAVGLFEAYSCDDQERLLSRCVIRDVSERGIGFVSAAPLRVGERFTIDFSSLGIAARIVCQAAYCRPMGGELYAQGASFVDVPGRLAALVQSRLVQLTKSHAEPW